VAADPPGRVSRDRVSGLGDLGKGCVENGWLDAPGSQDALSLGAIDSFGPVVVSCQKTGDTGIGDPSARTPVEPLVVKARLISDEPGEDGRLRTTLIGSTEHDRHHDQGIAPGGTGTSPNAASMATSSSSLRSGEVVSRRRSSYCPRVALFAA
jgi:hypothetical protein